MDYIWVFEGLGDKHKVRRRVGRTETVNDLRNEYAKKFDTRAADLDISARDKVLNRGRLSEILRQGEIVHITPRAKQG